jgi:hypothetical protein
VRCSILIAERWPQRQPGHPGDKRDAGEARGLISIRRGVLAPGDDLDRHASGDLIEVDNTASIRWYAREVLGLDGHHHPWLDMEGQIAGAELCQSSH